MSGPALHALACRCAICTPRARSAVDRNSLLLLAGIAAGSAIVGAIELLNLLASGV